MTEIKKWNVPLRKIIPALGWPRYIYQHICKCDTALLERSDMRDAFNHLVAVLNAHSSQLSTYAGTGRFREIGNLDTDINPITNFVNVPYTNREPEKLLHIVKTAYNPLLLLLRENVIPYMDKQRENEKNKANIKLYTKARDMTIQKFEKLTRRYEEDSKRLRNKMTHYQEYIDEIQNRLQE